MARLSKPICFKCRKTIHKNQKHSKCNICNTFCHNKCLFCNRRKIAPTNLSWNCSNCVASQQHAHLNRTFPKPSSSTHRNNENENRQLNSQILNEIFENREVNSESTDNDEKVICLIMKY